MTPCTRWPLALALAALLVGAAPALAQDALGAGELTGTLAKIKKTKVISIGYRDASVPFSYLNAVRDPGARQPIGYTIDICLAIVEDIRGELGDDTIQVRWLPVTPQTRTAMVTDGRVDLECGQTTNNAERRKEVAFSPIIFVSGTKLLVKRDSKLRSYRDLKGRTVVATEGSTNAAAVKAIDAKLQLGVKLTLVRDNQEAFQAVESGKADAWAGDDAVLYAMAAESKTPKDFSVLDEYLSYDPYGIMYRKNDAQLDALVKKSFEKLAETRELARIYEQWFLRKLPSGRTLGLSISPQLEAIFESLGQPTE
ncbi:MAG TPA: amino acid ABC transporter substrate-binding protein [Casimicrobiaceae bacterium]|nr:amino acid ABC transporter substrate-binding protein [Casimicrobiaceae bacterium]